MIPISFNISVLGHNIPNIDSFVYVRPVCRIFAEMLDRGPM